MNTSILTVMLAGLMVAAENAAPTWHPNYTEARQHGAAQKKPLVVVFGPGSAGWTKIVRGAQPSAEITQMLAVSYVCVHVDTANSAGKKLAQDFAITGNTGVVISDRTGAQQAFWHQGDLAGADLTRVLKKYADPNTAITTTETATKTRISNYAPTSAASAAEQRKGQILELTSANWQKEVIESKVPVVVDFWAPWCAPCMRIAPTIDRLAITYSGRVKFCKINFDQAGDIAMRFGVSRIPVIMVFQAGKSATDPILGEDQIKNQLPRAIDNVLE